MNKNEEIRELMEKLLPLCTLADKNFLIGLLNGILWKQKKSNSDEPTLEEDKNFIMGFLNGILWKQKKSNSDESTLEDES